MSIDSLTFRRHYHAIQIGCRTAYALGSRLGLNHLHPDCVFYLFKSDEIEQLHEL